jgi:hypothetical protein
MIGSESPSQNVFPQGGVSTTISLPLPLRRLPLVFFVCKLRRLEELSFKVIVFDGCSLRADLGENLVDLLTDLLAAGRLEVRCTPSSALDRFAYVMR